jgi:maleate isomerase
MASNSQLTMEGWRARIGVVLPSVNTVVESWFNTAVPPGVAVYVSRMYLPDGLTRESVKEMDRLRGMNAVKEVANCGVDVVAYCCTASSIVGGPEYDSDLIAAIERVSGTRATTAAASVVQGLNSLGAHKIVIGSPYAEDIEAAERDYFVRAGFEVLASRGLGITNSRELAAPNAADIYGFARSIWVTSADALVLTCANFKSHYVVEALEADLGCPVVTSTQATLWRALRLAGVAESLSGLGQLLRLSAE